MTLPRYKNVFVMVEYSKSVTSAQHEQTKKKLLAAGALDIKQESAIQRVVKDSKVTVSHNDINDVIDKFVKNMKDSLSNTKAKQGKEFLSVLQDPKLYAAIVKEGKDIAKEVDSMNQIAKVEREGPAFSADIHRLVLKDFLGVQGNTLEM